MWSKFKPRGRASLTHTASPSVTSPARLSAPLPRLRCPQHPSGATAFETPQGRQRCEAHIVLTVAKLGPEPYADYLATTNKLGVSKTNGLFQRVLKHLKVPNDQVVMVGATNATCSQPSKLACTASSTPKWRTSRSIRTQRGSIRSRSWSTYWQMSRCKCQRRTPDSMRTPRARSTSSSRTQ